MHGICTTSCLKLIKIGHWKLNPDIEHSISVLQHTKALDSEVTYKKNDILSMKLKLITRDGINI